MTAGYLARARFAIGKKMVKSAPFDSSRRKLLLVAGASLVPFALAGCGGGGGGGGGAGDGGSPTPVPVPTPTPAPAATMVLGPAIVVDQFGYLPTQAKIAVIRDPQVGFDASDSFAPGTAYELVNSATNAVVHSGSPIIWNAGATDAGSGDKAWHFDFSAITAAGDYFVRDVQRNVKSPTFKIAGTGRFPFWEHDCVALTGQRPVPPLGASSSSFRTVSMGSRARGARILTSPWLCCRSIFLPSTMLVARNTRAGSAGMAKISFGQLRTCR